MNSAPRDAPALGHRECLLSAVARTPSVTQVPPAKKITFLKRGDPRFAGVRLAVHQRTFKSFSALMDELSQRVPLSFGVRSVTTPGGLHGLSALEQLEDGGCYLCSDKKPPKPPSGPGRPLGRSPATQPARDSEGRREAPGTSSSSKGLKAPRKVVLVKNTDPRLQQTVVLSQRNTRNLAAFLSKASDVLCFPVKQVYTASGKKVDSLQALLHSPSVLVCAGNEAFRPLATEDARRNGMEASGLTSRTKTGTWGPKAKQSVIHLRSRPGSRAQPPEAGGPGPNRQDTPAQPGHWVAGDDMKKKVCMNEDGSLSVEMKVRFHLLGGDTLLWSQRVGRASTLTAASEEGTELGEMGPLCYAWNGHPGGCSEPGACGARPCAAGCQEAFGRGGQLGPRCEIWTNPLHASGGERPASRRRWGLAQHFCCRGPWTQGAASKERCSQDSTSLASSAGHPEGSEPVSSSCPRTLDGGVGGIGLSAQRGTEQEAVRGPSGGIQGQCRCLARGAQGEDGDPSDSSASARSHEVSRAWGCRGCQGKAKPKTSQWEAMQRGDPGSPTLSFSSFRNEDPEAEMHGQGSGHSCSWDEEEGSSPLPACALAQQLGGTQKSLARAVSSPSIPGLGQGAQRGHARQDRPHRDSHCPLNSPAAKYAPRPPGQGRACPDSPAPRFSGSPVGTSTRASGDLSPPSSGSFHSQDLPGASNAPITPASDSEGAPGEYSHDAPSAGWAGDAGSGACSVVPRPPQTPRSGSVRTPELSPPSGRHTGRAGSGDPGAPPGPCCSQTAPGAPRGPSSSEAPWAGSRYCPTPPRGRPCARQRSSSCGSIHGAPSGPGGSPQEAETPPGGHTPASGPNSREAGRSMPSSRGRSGGLSPGKDAQGGGGPEEQGQGGGVSPGALPQASPEAVVRAWLGNIPEEPMLVKYEMVDETPRAVGEVLEGPAEDPGDDPSPRGLGEVATSGQGPLEVEARKTPEPEGALPAMGDAALRSEEGPSQGTAPRGVSGAPERAEAGRGVGQGVLPSRVSASAQIMKALMDSKQGRPSSLPELSSPVAGRLSRSAGALITCLARLRFFDDDLGSPAAGKGRLTDSPRYRELLSLSQALWPGCDPGRGQLDAGLQEATWSPSGLGCHAVTEDLSPTSSSGVDVSSGSGGSGGSGESSVPCATDSALVPERTELPLTVSCQTPGSRTSENPEDLGSRQQSGSPAASLPQALACGTSMDGAEGGGEQAAGEGLEQLVAGTGQDEGARPEGLDEGGERETPEGGVREEGLSEGTVGSGWTLAGARAPCGYSEDAGRVAGSAEGFPVERREEPTEPPSHLRAGDSSASEGPSGPQLEPGLGRPPGVAEMEGVQTQAPPAPGAGEKQPSGVCRASLEADPIGVSALLKKMEKAFLAHLASAVAELRARWGLQDHDLLDQLAAELQQDVGQRLRDSTERELRKVHGRTGRTALRGELSLQTEQRRRRLQSLHNLSAFTEGTLSPGPRSLTLEDGRALSRALGTPPRGKEAEGEEFCPCEACVRKKASPVSPRRLAVGAAKAPIQEAFDLRQILQRKKGGRMDGEKAEVAPEEPGTEPLREDVSGTWTGPRADGGPELGLDLSPGLEEREAGEGGEEGGEREEGGDRKVIAEGNRVAQVEAYGIRRPHPGGSLLREETSRGCTQRVPPLSKKGPLRAQGLPSRRRLKALNSKRRPEASP
ncbi:LOW QUALITY PROTEIN: retinitis pigmentosa 1-like 1 protein [Carlito syrichta]|uniref:Retinitis pigmentosa 1-like 1 protein n=1 Tax=Carlito syrichta TaxID=1868482 RepID=A0A3Q0DTZ1_CARSF|nr:LOW QUALITY PROTEIN: retinitis pigmentosa 1-like 1 protein [Carlito syrichta]